ncbi:hypothetical protein SAMN05192588_2480 [Nonlabens sp. Hel1_33_55]|uniref:hypothetical protein n=1 Tax=Nonlabens sp. Hel1_33_55 TaxID=1336802 RepID=UPI000875E7F8|nr:hypothetical protein [Nonlabens sp. Hel1_33_55]SCY36116.1 hypothetical protein SAMN05192588_2480 [Nonlabens sp. Hel1_33_55]
MKERILVLLVLMTSSLVIAQNVSDNEKLWTSNEKLTMDDFELQSIANQSSDKIYSQFAITHSISGFDFLKRNFNQKIENKFITNASWIDTTQTVNEIESQIEYQQLQFDMAEVQARKFRKEAFINRKSILKGTDGIENLSNQMMNEFSRQRLALMQETDSGRDNAKVQEWKARTAEQLQSLDQFRFENTKRIRLED